MKANILLIEDDKNLGYVTRDNLEVYDYKVTLCEDGEKGLKVFNQERFDLALVDIMLPKMDGMTVVEKIREKNQDIPIIFLTAKSMPDDKIAGFKKGADDYITKPFSIEELVFRIEVFLKRSSVSPSQRNHQMIYHIGNYVFDHGNQVLQLGDEVRKLTQKEAAVLRMFACNINSVLRREEILLKIWGSDDYFVGRSLDVFISRLRKYLKDDPNLEITNYHSVGFKLEIKASVE
jgi:DNA-binding response OmpR family regulator